MKPLTRKTSIKVLKLLAEISTEEHATAIAKRNGQALVEDSSTIACPHCRFTPNGCYDCATCLWTYAILKVTHKCADPNKCVDPDKCCPCVMVRFTDSETPKYRQSVTPFGIYLSRQLLKVNRNCEDADYKATKDWLLAHIAWAQSPGWGTRKPPKGYRTTVEA